MSEDNNIKNYSVADIEKYWKGQLSNSESHALEKAAMEDPFLADAMEGYKNSLSPEVEIGLLKEKLTHRISSTTKIVSIRKKNFNWLKVAAAIVIIGGLGILAQQVFLNKKENELAGLDKNVKQAEAISPKTELPVKSDSIKMAVESKDRPVEKISVATDNDGRTDKAVQLFSDTVKSKTLLFKPEINKLDEAVVLSAPSKEIADEKKTNNALARSSKDNEVVSGNNKLEDFSKQKSQQAGAVSKKNADFISLNNRYNYKVVDAQNNPVPFANVSNMRDNVGTYTDIKGMFNLISSDSVMDVQIKSLGYNSRNYRLIPARTIDNLILEEDANARTQILASNRKVVSNRTREETAELEEPEVGWDNYNTYVANNIILPDILPIKKSGSEVELSFQVDKNGYPVNIKVTKSSSCKECDDAAVRVLKDGPKWSRKGKKSKTKVSIAVDK